jgi:hypothetical protein
LPKAFHEIVLTASGQLGLTKVLVHRFPAYAVVGREDGLGNSAGGPLHQLGRLFRREALFRP